MFLIRVRAHLWRGRHILLAITVLAGLFATVEAFAGMRPATVPVVVAASDLPAGTQLTSSDVRVATVATQLAPREAMSSTAEVEGEVLIVSLPQGMPLPRSMLLSTEFLDTAPSGHRIMSVTIVADGTEDLATPGTSVSLYAPPDEFSETGTAVLVADRATVVGHGHLSESGGFLSDSDNSRVLFLAVPEDRVTLVLGYGTRTPMRIELNAA